MATSSRLAAARADPVLTGLISMERKEDLQLLKELIEAGKGHAGHRYDVPAERGPREAIRYLEDEHAREKVVITV